MFQKSFFPPKQSQTSRAILQDGSRSLRLFLQGKKPSTVKILKFGTPQTIAIIVLKIEKFDVTLH